jgi:hypothetical protein
MLDGINVTLDGGNRETPELDVPELEAKYPSATMFGDLPAYAFYARHVEGLALGNIQARWTQEDWRPALIFDDVKDLRLHGFRADTVGGPQPVIWMNDTANAFVRGSSMAAGQKFLRVTGTRSADVKLTGNDLSGAKELIEYGSGVAKSVVRALAKCPGLLGEQPVMPQIYRRLIISACPFGVREILYARSDSSISRRTTPTRTFLVARPTMYTWGEELSKSHGRIETALSSWILLRGQRDVNLSEAVKKRNLTQKAQYRLRKHLKRISAGKSEIRL